MIPLERSETVAFVWPDSKSVPDEVDSPVAITEFVLDRTAFEHVQAAIGWQVTDNQWDQLMQELVPGSMVFVKDDSGEPMATACACATKNKWTELAWVAVAENHRGKRLGKVVCIALVKKLLGTGTKHIFGSTQDERLMAVRVYLEMGFFHVYRKEKVSRWRDICDRLDHPYTPRMWGWPAGLA